MKKLFLLGLVSLVSFAQDVHSFRDGEGTLHVTQEFATPEAVKQRILREGFATREEAPVDPAVIIDQIINLGSKIWKIIEAGKPVVDVKYAYANALPKGVRSSEELDGFSDLQFRSVRHYGKNLYGMVVYDVV